MQTIVALEDVEAVRNGYYIDLEIGHDFLSKKERRVIEKKIAICSLLLTDGTTVTDLRGLKHRHEVVLAFEQQALTRQIEESRSALDQSIADTFEVVQKIVKSIAKEVK